MCSRSAFGSQYWHINIYKHQMGAFQVESRVCVCMCVCVCVCVCGVCVCVCARARTRVHVCVHNKATRICHIHLRISSFRDVSYTLIADIRYHNTSYTLGCFEAVRSEQVVESV